MSKKFDISLILLAIAGFLAPLIGGKVAVDSSSLPPGTNLWASAFQGASETATLSHALLALLVASSLGAMLLQRKIIQVPNNVVGTVIIVLLALILSTVGYSSFRGVSIPAAVEWIIYGITLYAVVSAGGRQSGPLTILISIFAGCMVLGWLGINQYGEMKAQNASWRVFPQWAGPNAMAVVLVVGLFLGIAIAINVKRRGGAAGVGVGCVAIGLSLFLTGSKGVIAAFAVCLVVFLVLLFLWLPRKEALRSMGTAGAIVGAILLLCVALSMQPRPKSVADSGGKEFPTESAGGHLLDSGASAEQSVGFRKLLWQSAIKLMELNPIGIGIGSFQYESARPGLVTQTHLAHNEYLQLGAEASFVAPILLIAGFALWTRLLMRGGAKLKEPQNVLRAAVFSAVLAVLGHSLVDSDFSYFGVGFLIFMLMGVGLLLSADAVAPEFLPAMLRRASAAGIAVITLFMLYLGYAEAERAQAKGDIAPALNDARMELESLRSSAPWDAEVWSTSAMVTEDPVQRLAFARKAVELGPTTRNLRTLARVSAGEGMYSDALGALRRTMQLDPNNMEALRLEADIEEQMGQDDRALETLKELIKIEETPYFKVRSLPELVVTTTFEARVRVAAKTSDNKEKVSLLQPAIDGFKHYLEITVPAIQRFTDASGTTNYGGEDQNTAKKKMSIAAEAAKSLAGAYRASGDTVNAGVADDAAAVFAKPLDFSSAK